MTGEAVTLPPTTSKPSRPAGLPFAVLFIASGLMTVGIVWLAALGPGSDEDRLPAVLTALIVNAGLLLSLLGLVARRILAVMRSREAGSRLHLRYMSLFAVAAAAPAIIVAFFFGVLITRAVDGWFSEPVVAVVENTRPLADVVMAEQNEDLQPLINAATTDLVRYLGDLRSSPESYERLLSLLVQEHGFKAIHIIDRQATVLASAARPDAPPFIPPAADFFIEADTGDEAALQPDPDADLVRLLILLDDQPKTYAWIQAPIRPGLLRSLKEAEEGVVQFQAVSDARRTIQAVFMAIYIETALLVLVAALWLGMRSASVIAEPVAQLIRASNKVASGDLKARVPTDSSLEEINALSTSFNKMTDDLNKQTGALMFARAEAENRRQFIETVLAGVSAGVLGLDADGRISVCNAQAGRLLEAEESGLSGRSLEEVAPELIEVADEAAQAGAAEDEVDVLRRGENRRLRVRAAGSAGEGLVLTFDDITRLVSAQRNAAWRDVARRIAHEIKNPLTPIQLSAERLRRKYRKDVSADVETFDRCTDTIIRQVGDIGRMVDEFSAFARMPAPRYTPCDAGELLREAVFARRVASPEIELVLEDNLGEAGGLLCDERMVSQALTNILKNAAEAIAARVHQEPDHKGRILARVSQFDGQVAFEIEDNGVGLPVADRDRLTEPYVTTREKGTGLGLAIVRRILEDHGGILTLRDAAHGGGALVSLILPKGGLARPQHEIRTVQAQG